MPRKKRTICTIDTETDPFEFGVKVAPFVWGFFDGETFEYFWGETEKECGDKLIAYLETRDYLLIYAHNGGKFDFMFLLEHLDPKMMIVNGRIAKATMFDGAIELRDSWMIIPIPLKQYDKDDIDYNKLKRGVRNIHKNEIIRYLRKDCTSLYELVYAFCERFGRNLTLAGTAFKELKKTGYEITNTNEEFDNTMRPFYFGGRVQCFQVGSFKEDLQYVDINSAYPYAMKTNHWYGPGFKETTKLPKGENRCFFAKIEATSQGALPYRHENKLYFPDDQIKRIYYASSWEIASGLDTGTLKIHRVIKCHVPTLTLSFAEYVEKYFAEKFTAKASGDKIAELFAKLLLNSAYGKFGQDGRKFEEFCIVEYGEWPEDTSLENRWHWHSDTDTGQSFFRRDAPSDRFYNVATAASVTGFVRAFLWKSILACEKPLYCDTDSIICSKFNGDMGKELGQWDLEAELSEAHIAQRKMYALKLKDGSTKVASKGVRLDYDEIKNGVKYKQNVNHRKDAPAYSIKYGPRFFTKQINFENIEKNLVNNPLNL